ncbi:MAG: FHA domain-containing protein [Deltaproteobacteria bacterium]|nr:FHA domain-containing protein [Deltaproteobacteria bacterium]
MAFLWITNRGQQAGEGRRWELTRERMFLGRSPDNDIVIEAEGVSRRHAQLARTPQGWVLSDLGSANGSWIGTQRVGNVLLSDGLSVRLGEALVTFRDLAAGPTTFVPAPAAPPATAPGAPPSAPARSPGPRPAARPGLSPAAIWAIAFGVLALAAGAVLLAYLVERDRETDELAAAGAGELPEPLRGLGPLAQLTGTKAEGELATGGSDVALGDGASLVAAAGALPRPVRVSVRRIDLALDVLDVGIRRSWAYDLRTDADVESFGAPVAIEIPRPAEFIAAAFWDGHAWHLSAVERGPDGNARILVAHFSNPLFAILEFFERISARTQRTNQAILGEDSPESKLRQTIDRHGSPGARTFGGVGETLSGRTHAQLCDEIAGVIRSFPGVRTSFPWSSHFTNNQLRDFLQGGDSPSVAGGYFWDLTKDRMDGIRQGLLASPGQVTPGQFLGICLRECNGNVNLAVLACHNFLKEVTHQGRYQGLNVSEEWAAPVAKLLTWRTEDVSPAGHYDKMGPLYHLFAAMTAGVWFNGLSAGGYAAATAEALLRTFSHGGDRPDPEKGQADACGATIATLVRAQALGLGTTPPSPPAPLPAEDAGTPPPPPDAGSEDGSEGFEAEQTEPDAVDVEDLEDEPEDVDDEEEEGEDGNPFDAEPAPATEHQEWVGRWRGEARASIDIDGLAVVDRQPLDLTLTRLDETTVRLSDGAKTLDMRLSATNPNVSFGRNEIPIPMLGGMIGEGHMVYEATAFLRDGRLYFAFRSVATATGHLPIPDAPDVTSTTTIDALAILSRVP